MGPEGEFRVSPGRVFIVPLGPDGEPRDSPREWGPLDEVGLNFARGFDWGSGEGLEGGLQGWPDGARMEAHGGDTWNIQLEFSGEVSEETVALLMGFSVEEWQDLKRWAVESAWLERVTGLNWGRFE